MLVAVLTAVLLAEVVAQPSVNLPEGVAAVWDLARAHREATPTRERVCLNGLWRWQPATPQAVTVPAEGWGYFKVPGSWPGITSYMQKDSQTVHVHPDWRDVPLREITAAWYQRSFSVPATWGGRRIAVAAEYVNSYGAVFVDGENVGELRFPAGEVDVTRWCRPGSEHVLSLLVVALPLKGVLVSYTDTAAAREVKGAVERRGLCGDVFLAGRPAGARLDDARVVTSVRHGRITLTVGMSELLPDRVYRLHARITEEGQAVREFESGSFRGDELPEGRFTFGAEWRPTKLWDIHTPQHQYDLHLALREEGGSERDELPPVRFGFREFGIEGRDFMLNGTRLFLSAVPLDNAQVGAAAATYAAARESLERLRRLGINFVYTHHYDCLPGAHLSLAEILRAADDVGMLVALTQPHFSHYDWGTAEADRTNGYARHAAFYAGVAGNHPAVVMYATSHNATGYNEDMNPDLLDGRSSPRDNWASNNMKKALRAEAIVRALDPERLVYHHASGNLGLMHSSNFYPNFVPVQELSDWFETWSTRGTKPLFLCEYGAPFTWDWAMYRGWYEGRREFGSAVVPWEFCLAEWNASFFGDRAFAISEAEKRNLRWEARQFREGRRWHRWDYPHQLGSNDFAEREPVFARYFTENWRAFRTWELSANSPWEHHILFKLRPGMVRNRREALPVDWAGLQRPGFSPDYLGERFERMDMAYGIEDWVATGGGEAILRNNQPLLAYVAGGPERFTSRGHNSLPGETVTKQLVVINNARVSVAGRASWVLGLAEPLRGQVEFSVETGQQVRLPMRFELPPDVAPGEYGLEAEVEFATGEVQSDRFTLHVLPAHPARTTSTEVVLFDSVGETADWLRGRGVRFRLVGAEEPLGVGDVLVVGKGALSVDGPVPNLEGVREGLRVLVFEQMPAVLERRFGFRVVEHGLRQVFPRVPDHPVLAGLATEHLRDWQGAATLLPPRLKYELSPRYNGAPTVKWCGLEVPRAWRCGHEGSVASVLIEKPARGDFLPLLDGGFSLQYSPLLAYREGKGGMVFCQMDVTGRTVTDPAAARLADNLLDYVAKWQPAPRRSAVYVGAENGRTSMEAAGVGFATLPVAGSWRLDPEQVLVVGAGGGRELAGHREGVAAFLEAGGRVLALGLDQAEADAFLPFGVTFREAEHIAAFFDPPGLGSPFAGVGPADVHNRDPRTMPLVGGGAAVVGNGVLAMGREGTVVFCQLAPWQFDYRKNYGLKRTFRRTGFLVNRLLANLGVQGETPLLARWSTPVRAEKPGRWREGFYLDQPEEWDDPYRFFRW
ncbi:MAG: hypothetical protein HS113_03085 [Verrucomicrobiales bacterium]|nr:hypothetical protein [Verrucomicrobiales bacterium]